MVVTDYTGPLDLTLRSVILHGREVRYMKMEEDNNHQFGFDSCGALDLSSTTSASSGVNSTKASDEENSDNGGSGSEFSCGKRKSMMENEEEMKRKRNKLEHNPMKKRKNIRDVIGEDMLADITKEARSKEEERLKRLKNHDNNVNEDLMVTSSDSDEHKAMSDVSVDEDEDEDDPNNSGMHVNDALNIPDSDGNVLVNVHHPKGDPDIFLAPQLANIIKPHQIGGVRFLYDNVVESASRFSTSQGYGCILAHSMGLGKTMQLVSFIDVFLTHTVGRSVLCIVPINTIQNWLAEFNYWLPAQGETSPLENREEKMKHRDFPIYLLNDTYKNLQQRANVISEWGRTGGVLMMGYELYRQLANRKPRKKRSKNESSQGEKEREDKLERKFLSEIQSQLVNPGPDLVICDEGHRIKNSHASISQALKQIRTRRRVVLTGYPLQNNLMEYWCMVDWVRPNFLGNKTEFSNMFERPIQNGQCSDSTPKDKRLMKHRAHVLHQQLRGFVQRRGHIVLKHSLPTKTEHVLFIRMTEIQRRLYRRFMEELITNRCVSNPLKAFAVCCKIWNHPDVLYNYLQKREEEDLDIDQEEAGVMSPHPGVRGTSSSPAPETPAHLVKKEEINYEWAQGMFSDYVPGVEEYSNKLNIFMGILEESLACDDRILLFSQSLFTLNLIEDFMKQKKLTKAEKPWVPGVTYYRLDGSTSALERERLINNFNNDSSVKLFLVSTRAGSLGVNLVGANRVVIFDASWNPCHDTQAVCRVYRYGQKKETHVYRLVTDYSLEKKIYDRQVNKQGMADRIVDELNPDAHLSTRDVHSLICDEEEELENTNISAQAQNYPDPVMKNIVQRHGAKLTRLPFAHESLLVDRKDNKLSKAEKKLAEKAYKLERTSKITYSRPSYAAFYPKQGTFATNLNNPGSNGYTRNRYYENGKKLDTWLPNKTDPYRHVEAAFPVPSFSNVLGAPPASSTNGGQGSNEWKQKAPAEDKPMETNSKLSQLISHSSPKMTSNQSPMVSREPSQSELSSGSSSDTKSTSNGPPMNSNRAMEALSRQGVQLQQVTVPRNLSIPTGPTTPPVDLVAGQNVMVIKTVKGIYLKLGEKIIKIKQLQAVQGLLGESETP